MGIARRDFKWVLKKTLISVESTSNYLAPCRACYTINIFFVYLLELDVTLGQNSLDRFIPLYNITNKRAKKKTHKLYAKDFACK